MPGIPGKDPLQESKQNYTEVPVIIITGTDDLNTAVECMKLGAFDYLVKVVEESKLVAAVKRAVEFQDLRRENLQLKDHFLSSEVTQPEVFSDIVTISPKMRSIFLYMETVASTPKPILITGETGVGKELIARALHELSGRKGNYVAVNISSFDDTLFSDTVFGHRKGAFTGAETAKEGLIETASGGTLFLDEIGDLSPTSQIKLLRLLENGEYLPLGSSFMKKSESRILVATNRDLEAEVQSGRFRKDLYFRLFTHHINIPPLRQRKEDLPILTEYFFSKAAEELGRPKPGIPSQLLSILENYSFPGNIRELESFIQDTMSRSEPGTFRWEIIAERTGITKPADEEDKETPRVIFLNALPSLKAVSEILIDEALKRSGGNQSIAARKLGISQQALSKRLKQRKS
jgi:DNA-binding NtrC family response regulator